MAKTPAVVRDGPVYTLENNTDKRLSFDVGGKSYYIEPRGKLETADFHVAQLGLSNLSAKVTLTEA